MMAGQKQSHRQRSAQQQVQGGFVAVGCTIGAQAHQNCFVIFANAGVQGFDAHDEAKRHGHFANGDQVGVGIIDGLDRGAAGLACEQVLNRVVLNAGDVSCCRGIAGHQQGGQDRGFHQISSFMVSTARKAWGGCVALSSVLQSQQQPGRVAIAASGPLSWGRGFSAVLSPFILPRKLGRRALALRLFFAGCADD